jgi:oligopeptide transport system ATP-binding protein
MKDKQEASFFKVENLKVHFPLTKGIAKKQIGVVRAVDGVSFALQKGKTIGIVGESGCGKTTTGKAILRMVSVTDGKVFLADRNVLQMKWKEHREVRRKIQMIFQDPYSSLDPRQTAFSIIREVLVVDKKEKPAAQVREEVEQLLEMVGLSAEIGERYPHELSGGQRQRIGIARALACHPEIIICDEPVSALDVSIQAQIINLLKKLQDTLGLTYVFIAHDLAVVRHIADTVYVMYLGKIVETMKSDDMYKNPLHPYTKALLSAIPVVDYHIEKQRKRIKLKGEVPSPINAPTGCPFHPRCPYALENCSKKMPGLELADDKHYVACFRYKELGA